MELSFGHLCDYATQGANGKLILVGLFDQLNHTPGGESIRLPLCFLVFKLACGIAEGTEHRIQVRLKDGEEATLRDEEANSIEFDLGVIRFSPSGPGRPLAAQGIIPMAGIPFPAVDDYAFEIRAGGTKVGEIPLYVVQAPNARA